MNHRTLALYATWLLLSALAAPACAITAGSIAFAQGDVSIRSAGGATRDGGRGAEIQAGETVETGNGRAQLAMADGAYISLQPRTALAFEAYQTAEAGRQEQGLMNLLRGGVRTITGLIGRSNRRNYAIKTPTATIGIRGTEFLALVGDDGTRVRVAGGVVSVCNDGGCLDVATGQTGYAPNSGSQPALVSRAPLLPPEPAPVLGFGYVGTEQRNSDGQSALLAGANSAPAQSQTQVPAVIPIAGGSGSVSLTWNVASSTHFGGATFGVANLAFNNAGAMTSFGTGPDMIAGTIAEFNADGIIAWGRWTSGTSNLNPAGAITSLPYIAFNSTQTPSVPVVQTYAAFASTAPVLTSSANGAILATGLSNTVTGTLGVNFTGNSGGTVTYLLQVPISGQTFTLNGVANQFSTTGFLGATSTITSNGSGCSSTCTGAIPNAGTIQGSLAGTGSTRVGATYGFNTSLGGVVSGAVVFK